MQRLAVRLPRTAWRGGVMGRAPPSKPYSWATAPARPGGPSRPCPAGSQHRSGQALPSWAKTLAQPGPASWVTTPSRMMARRVGPRPPVRGWVGHSHESTPSPPPWRSPLWQWPSDWDPGPRLGWRWPSKTWTRLDFYAQAHAFKFRKIVCHSQALKYHDTQSFKLLCVSTLKFNNQASFGGSLLATHPPQPPPSDLGWRPVLQRQ